MKIEISDSARQYLRRKLGFFQFKSRRPRLIQVAKTCHGAEFRLVFEPVRPTDQAVVSGELELFLERDLPAEFGGFSIDVESFFFAPRLLIKPFKQSYNCDCKAKCPKRNSENMNLNEIEEQ